MKNASCEPADGAPRPFADPVDCLCVTQQSSVLLNCWPNNRQINQIAHSDVFSDKHV